MTNHNADRSHEAEVLEKEAAQIDARSEDAAAEIAELVEDTAEGGSKKYVTDADGTSTPDFGRTGPAVAFKGGEAPDEIPGVDKDD